jgi:fumarate reductase subunit C
MSSTVTQVRLWYWQRVSAMALSFFVLVHLAIIIYAVRGGLSGGEILARTHGSWLFGLFYGAFVLACAVHVPIGLDRILREMTGMKERSASWLSGLFGLLLLVMGLRAVYGVVLA